MGSKHSEETIRKFKARSFTPEQKKKHLENIKEHLKILHASEAHKERARKNIFEHNQSKSKRVEVLDTWNNVSTVYASACEAAREIGCSDTAIRKV